MVSENPLPFSPFHSSYQKPLSSLSFFLLPPGRLGGVELFRGVRGGRGVGWMDERVEKGGRGELWFWKILFSSPPFIPPTRPRTPFFVPLPQALEIFLHRRDCWGGGISWEHERNSLGKGMDG